MIQELNVGETVKVKSFAFINKAGGTGLSEDGFTAIFKVTIIKRWDDYECGERGWAVPISKDLRDYLKENAMNGIPNLRRHELGHRNEPATDNSEVYVIFINEFDLVEGK